MGVGMLFSHESLKTFSTRGDRNDRVRWGIWPHVGRSSPELVLGCLSFQPRVTIAIQFNH